MSHLQLLALLLSIAQVLQVETFQLHHDLGMQESAIRIPRSPNKFESLKRREREQRLIELGAITPDIASDTPREIRAHEGDTVYLPCRVPHLGTHSVTWETKGTILSVDTMLVDQNPRLAVSNDEDMWRLVLKRVQDSDAGVYTCTITTEPRQQRDVTLFVMPRSASLMYDSYGIVLGDIRANLSAVWAELRSMRNEIAQLSGSRQNTEQDEEDWSQPPVEQLDLHHHHRTVQRHPVHQFSLAHRQREEAVVYEPAHPSLVDNEDEDVNVSEEIQSTPVLGRQIFTSGEDVQEPFNPSPVHGSSRLRHPHRSSRRGSRRRQHRPRRVEATAECVLHPDETKAPESRITGTITLSQPGDLRGPVSLDVQITGFQDSKLDVVGLSLRRYAVEDGRCHRAGDILTSSSRRHDLYTLEDLRGLMVGLDDTLSRHLQLPEDFTLFGLGGIVGKSIVVSSEEEDMRNRMGSMTSGSPVACCTIQPTRSRVPALLS
ncbi:Immunoglobulin I-set [Trinorchestia longiramus]|nr:Immunoglobulin I-set [Trinorchestia longiramus]